MKWFSNLRVAMKLVVGFGIVLLAMVFLAAAVLVTNRMISTNLHTISGISSLSTEANNVLDSFNDARIGVSALYKGYDEDAVGRVQTDHIAIRNNLQEVHNVIDSSPAFSQFADGINTVGDILEQWMQATNDLIAVNLELERMQHVFASKLEEAEEIAYENIYHAQFENLDSDLAEGKDAESITRRKDRVYHGTEIVVGILEIGVKFEDVIAYHDLSGLAEAEAYGDEILASLELYKENSSQDKDKEAAQQVIDALTEYLDMLDEYVVNINAKNASVSSVQNFDDQTTAIIFDYIHDLDYDLEEGVLSADATGQTARILAIVLSIIAGFAGVGVAILLNNNISKPLAPLNAFMKKAGTTGDLTLMPHDIEVIGRYSQNKDEIGQTINNTAAFITRVTDIAEMLHIISRGDLTVDVNVLSEHDTMGTSLSDMVEQLNKMFDEINSATGLVSEGARQLADGSQALAQGSTEQSASVQQLSSSISEIADKTKENADMASRAAILATTIKGNAEKGNRQMDDMMAAVKDINQASQSISKVIKTIDDIAFQTNILALNAAVEAARAGQHGKGFAVVAEEVRNLASKSSDAASETSSLIANSMEKAELGSRIADETAASLAEIVSGINESSEIIHDIAQSSDEQQAGIGQINQGIEQVAQVVQQNSATAEQSAAASEEMSSQSTVLQSLIEQFKIKSAGSAGMSLPPSRHSAPEKAGTSEQNDPSGGYAGHSDEFGKY